MMQKYVVGFLLTPTRVVLIRKTKPEWQKGKLNGIGGKIEPGEIPYEAMVREFQEEANATVKKWRQYSELTGAFGKVLVFNAFVEDYELEELDIKTMTEEQVEIVYLSDLAREGVLPSAMWLIWQALDDNVYSTTQYLS